jgi:hypothetical protein
MSLYGQVELVGRITQQNQEVEKLQEDLHKAGGFLALDFLV